jgi:opacity protein-like surface antigen
MMMLRKAFLVLLVAWLLAPSARASAEWFGDLYVGPAFTTSYNVRFKYLASSYTARDVGVDTTATFGGRLGHWLEALPYLGFAADLYHFMPDMNSSATECHGVACGHDPKVRLDLGVTGIAADVMARWPLLMTKEIPNGQLQPYLTIGPTLFVTRISRLRDVGSGAKSHQSDTDTSVGLKTGAGLAWQFSPNIAVFGEYRFTHFSPDFSVRDKVFKGSPNDKAETTLNTHHALMGVSFRF